MATDEPPQETKVGDRGTVTTPASLWDRLDFDAVDSVTRPRRAENPFE
jgi:hypothetical protein